MPQRILRDPIEVTIESPVITFRGTDGTQYHQMKDGGGSGIFGGTITDLKQLGGKGDGTTDDTAAVTSAQASSAIVFTPPGTYKTTIAAASLTGRFRGLGQVQDAGGNKRAPWFSAISAAPSSRGTWTSVGTAFNGDLSKVQIAMEHRVTGSATLSQPSTGYQNNQEAAPFDLFLYNESGWNQQTSGNDGRTGLSALYVRVYQNGQGDLGCYNANAFVLGAKASATSFLANPAGILYNGEVDAGADGVYLNPVEIDLTDQGHDVAGVGAVYNFTRTVSTGALDVMWNGVRLQNLGSQPLDVGFMLVNSGSGNGARVGLDLAKAGLTTTGTWINAAITLSQDQRVYLNATGSDSGASIYRRPSSTGTTYLSYNSSLSAVEVVVGGTSVLQLKSPQITMPVNLNLASGKVYEIASTQVVGARRTGWTAWTGTATRTTFDTGTATLTNVAQALKALLDDLIAHGLIGA